MGFQIITEAIDIAELKKGFSPEVGAVSIFAGVVRNLNEGKEVTSLEYECYQALAATEGHGIIEEARSRFDLIDIRCQHRVGHLQIGEIAIGVVTFSQHRREAMNACSWVVDRIKSRVPIWKKEHCRDGKSEWIYCPHCETHEIHESHDEYPAKENFKWEEKDYFAAQTNIKRVGKTGMERLKRARVTVVGVGGLGTVALENMVRMGIGNITMIDHDRVSVSNLSRQTLFTTDDIGKPKTEVAAVVLKKINPWVKVILIPKRLDRENIETLLAETDLVIDCSDNFQTKFLIHDHCCDNKLDLIQASVFQFEGQLNNFFFQDHSSPCLRCLYPDPPSDLCGNTCAETGILTSTVSLFGTLQAHEAFKRILRQPGLPQGEMRVWDLESGESQSLRWKRRSDCAWCGEGQRAVKDTENVEEVNQVSRVRNGDIVIATSDVHTDIFSIELRLEGKDYKKIDWENLIDRDKCYVLVCRRGIRSYEMVSYLNGLGFKNVFSLKHGIESYSPAP